MEKSRVCLLAAGAAFVFFVADILLAKIQVLSGKVIPIHLGDTLQLLVLLVAVTFFVAGTLIREMNETESQESVTRGDDDVSTGSV